MILEHFCLLSLSKIKFGLLVAVILESIWLMSMFTTVITTTRRLITKIISGRWTHWPQKMGNGHRYGHRSIVDRNSIYHIGGHIGVTGTK